MVDPEDLDGLSFAQLRERLEELRQTRSGIARKLWWYVGVILVIVALTSVTARLFSQGRLSAAYFLATEGIAVLIVMMILSRVMWLIRKRLNPVQDEIYHYDTELKWRASNL